MQFEEQKSPSHLICQDEYPFRRTDDIENMQSQTQQDEPYENSLHDFSGICDDNEYKQNFKNTGFFEFESPQVNSYNLVDFSRQNSFSLQDTGLRLFLKKDVIQEINHDVNDDNINDNINNEIFIKQKSFEQIDEKQSSQQEEFPSTRTNSVEKEKKQKQKIAREFKLKKKKDNKMLKKSNKIKKISSIRSVQTGFESLALRNIKTNLASGLIQFISFKHNLDIQRGNFQNSQIYSNIVSYLYQKFPLLRSFSGWRDIWNDKIFGERIKKLCLCFFGKSFAKYYILGSRVKENYKNQYVKKIKKFYQGAQNPQIFNSFNFNN